MKKLVLFFAVAVLLTLAVSIEDGYAQEVRIREGVQVTPPRSDPDKPEICIAMQAVWDPGLMIWRRQIIPFNKATKDMVTEEMKQRAIGELNPTRTGDYKWEPWQFTIIYPGDGIKPTADKTKTVAAVAPLPKLAQPTADTDGLKKQLAAKKAELTAAEAAQSARPKEAAPTVVAKPKPAVKKAPKVSPLVAENAELKAKLEACEANTKKLADEKAGFEKSLGECQAKTNGLAEKSADFEKSLIECKELLTKAKNKAEAAEKNEASARKALSESFSVFAFYASLLTALIVGFALGIAANRLLSSQNKTAGTP